MGAGKVLGILLILIIVGGVILWQIGLLDDLIEKVDIFNIFGQKNSTINDLADEDTDYDEVSLYLRSYHEITNQQLNPPFVLYLEGKEVWSGILDPNVATIYEHARKDMRYTLCILDDNFYKACNTERADADKPINVYTIPQGKIELSYSGLQIYEMFSYINIISKQTESGKGLRFPLYCIGYEYNVNKAEINDLIEYEIPENIKYYADVCLRRPEYYVLSDSETLEIVLTRYNNDETPGITVYVSDLDWEENVEGYYNFEELEIERVM